MGREEEGGRREGKWIREEEGRRRERKKTSFTDFKEKQCSRRPVQM